MNSGDRAVGGTSGPTDMGGKVRLYEVAKDLGLANKDLVTKVRALGIEVKNHMSNLDVEDVARVKRALDKERQSNLVEERLSSTVIRRRSKDGTQLRADKPEPAAEEPVVRRRVVVEPAHSEQKHVETKAKPEPHSRRPEPVVEQHEEVAAQGQDQDRGQDRDREEHSSVRHGHDDDQVAAHSEVSEPEERAAEPAPRVDSRRIIDIKAPQLHRRPTDNRAEAKSPVVEHRVESRVSETPPPEPVVAPAADAAPAKPEPQKLGPTGRVIELPPPRIEIRQADPRLARDPRGVLRQDQRREAFVGGDRARPAGGHNRQPFGKKKVVVGNKKQKSTQITTPAAHKRVIKMDETITVGELAKQMGTKATDVLKKLWSMGMTGITLNNSIDQDTATLLAQDFGFDIESTAFQESEVLATADDKAEDLVPRAPVVTIMGHVDHGKTSLLDAIRDANVAQGEAGGITQHIGAYKITTANGHDVVFLDTPGHEAFTAMRARGAQVTDIVVLVVAADDGVMPTTIEALNHAKQAGVTIIVAVNKIDKPGANPDRIRQQLSEHGLISEAWGGETIFVDVSARTKVGIDTLLQMLALQSEVLELKANPNKLAKGTVVEAKLDRNRGPMATVLVQEGTMRLGDVVVAGEFSGKVRAMLDAKGRNVTEAGPSTPVELLGLSGVPDAGEFINSVSDEKQVKELIEHRRDSRRKKELAGTAKVTLENILERIKEGAVKELKVVLKADVQGSAEAVRASLIGLSTEQVKVDVIYAGVGGITESDINLAKAGNAIVVGFHVRPAGKAAQLAEQESVDVKLYDIIYEALDDVKKAMAGLLAPVKREKALGKAEVRMSFTIPKIGTIAGCGVMEGIIKRSASIRLVRDHVTIWTGKISSLRRFKDDVREVQQGYECGIGIENYNDLKEGDIIEAFEIEEFAPTLA